MQRPPHASRLADFGYRLVAAIYLNPATVGCCECIALAIFSFPLSRSGSKTSSELLLLLELNRL